MSEILDILFVPHLHNELRGLMELERLLLSRVSQTDKSALMSQTHSGEVGGMPNKA